MLIDEVEKYRKRLVFVAILFIASIIFLIVFLMSKLPKYNVFTMYIFIGIVLCCISTIFITSFIKFLNKIYSNKFKKYLSFKIINSEFENIRYVFDDGLELPDIKRANLLKNGTYYRSCDYISGKYNGVFFEQSYVNLMDRGDSNRDDRTQIFKGKWLILKFENNLKSNIQIIQKSFNQSINSFMTGTIWVKDIFGRKHLDQNHYLKLNINDDAFNDNFNAYIDSVEVVNLNPLLIQNICNLKYLVDGKLLFSFMNNELHVGIHNTKNGFVPKGIFKKINEYEAIKNMQNEFEFIKKIIDDIVLKLV